MKVSDELRQEVGPARKMSTPNPLRPRQDERTCASLGKETKTYLLPIGSSKDATKGSDRKVNLHGNDQKLKSKSKLDSKSK